MHIPASLAKVGFTLNSLAVNYRADILTFLQFTVMIQVKWVRSLSTEVWLNTAAYQDMQRRSKQGQINKPENRSSQLIVLTWQGKDYLALLTC